jgi:hypothetical protein
LTLHELAEERRLDRVFTAESLHRILEVCGWANGGMVLFENLQPNDVRMAVFKVQHYVAGWDELTVLGGIKRAMRFHNRLVMGL